MLEAKKTKKIESGFDVEESELNPSLFDFQRYCVKRMVKDANGWLCAYADDQDWVADRIEYMKRSGKYTFNKNMRKASSSKGKVALRIDSRTVIYVDRKKANETYAEEYRKRLEAQKTERYEPVDKTDSKRKRGGRR